MNALCVECQQRPRRARGWCNTCYMRWVRAGRPDTGPPAIIERPATGHTATCVCGCGETGVIIARGWIRGCYFRWYRAGCPNDGPPPRQRAATGDTEYRMSEYLFLLSCGESTHEAARRIGIQPSTAEQYLRDLRRQAVAA
jgi:hypothetical protein